MISINQAGPRLYAVSINAEGRNIVKLFHSPDRALRWARIIGQGATIKLCAATRAKLDEREVK